MKKRILALIIAMVTLMMCTGCSWNKLSYDWYTGYDFSNVKYKNITFNIYHSNTEDHKWELIGSLPCEQKEGLAYDVNFVTSEGSVVVELLSSDLTETGEGSDAYIDANKKVEDLFEYEVNGYEGELAGYNIFDIENKEGEQLLRVYPITNDDPVYPGDEGYGLDIPYDMGDIDDILITIDMEN